MTRGGLAQALDDLVAVELMVPKGKHRELVPHCSTGTMSEILEKIGLVTSPATPSGE
jgi:hypothetical protein